MFDQEPPDKAAGVYQIRCRTNGKIYLGSTVNLRSRFFKHRRELAKGVHHSQKLQRAWAKYGAEAFVFETLEVVARVEQLLPREQKWLDRTQPWKYGYNICREGRNRLGVKSSEETKRKIGNANRGKKRTSAQVAAMSKRMQGTVVSSATRKKIGAASRGRKHTEEAKRRIGEAHRGKEVSSETREKISRANRGNQTWLGRTHSSETKEKMSAARRGSKLSPEAYQRVATAAKRTHTGKTVSDTTREKIAASKRGRKHSEATKRKLREAWARRKAGCVKSVTDGVEAPEAK